MIPDLLHLEPRQALDVELVSDLLDLSFMGKDAGLRYDQLIAEAQLAESSWDPQFFAADLFVREFIADSYSIVCAERRYTLNEQFFWRVLTQPPTDPREIDFRQQIAAELDSSPALVGHAEELYCGLYALLASLKLPGHAARLDINAYRLDVMRKVRWAVDYLTEHFCRTRSGLRRLGTAGEAIRASDQYDLLDALLDWQTRMSTVTLNLDIGADGKVNRLQVRGIEENVNNRFYKQPLSRWRDRLSFLWRGYNMSRDDVVGRLLCDVFTKISPTVVQLLQLQSHLEVYLANRGFRAYASKRGLAVCLPSFDSQRPMSMDKLFNPLLLGLPEPTVACDIESPGDDAINLITGPNSGGKTRLLQALGLVQVLGQAGLYAPARGANLMAKDGLFVSLIEREVADQAEGRLGRELLRIRTIFDNMDSGGMVILDELCSGTNPSEGIEVFTLVLRLLDRLGSLGFISTHFLDYARGLSEQPPLASLRFLQVEVGDSEASTYQFIPGVAATSLAAAMAQRMGVTFEKLASAIDRRAQRGGQVKDLVS